MFGPKFPPIAKPKSGVVCHARTNRRRTLKLGYSKRHSGSSIFGGNFVYQKALYAAYVDLNAAVDLNAEFDSVDWQDLWKAIQRVDVPQKILGLIWGLHSSTRAKVQLNGQTSNCFPTTSGIQQGCVIVPALFCRVMDVILNQATQNNRI